MRLMIFDVDGTLVAPHTEELLPLREAFFRRLAPGIAIALASNQGGVGLRYWMETEGWGDPSRLPSLEQAVGRLQRLARRIASLSQREPRIYMAFAYRSRKGEWGPIPPYSWWDPRWDRDWRKPAPGMLRQALRDSDLQAEEALMIGDRPEDREAAAAAGIPFEPAERFFGREALLLLEEIWGEIAAEGADGWEPAWQCGPQPDPIGRATAIVARIQEILKGEG